MESKYEKNILSVLRQAGFTKAKKVAATLQGQIWKSFKRESNEEYVIKVTSKELHKQSSTILNGRISQVQENIIREKQIMQYLSSFTDYPSSLIKYKGFFRSNTNYYLMMENGEHSIFDFILKVHKLIQLGKLEICEWHRLVKIIFKQMIEAIDFLHSKNVAHFDVSLENTLINDITICIVDANTPNEKIKFVSNYNEVKVKIIDFGLAELFDERDNFETNKYCGKRNYQCPEIVYKTKSFNAASNDIWCVGVCLFMMIFGSAPFYKAHHSDKSYEWIINGELKHLVTEWNRLSYFDNDLLDLLTKIFQFEEKRISVQQIKRHKWLRNIN